MISASNDLKTLLYQSRTVNIGAGCTVEYNMNEMLDNIVVSTSISDSTYSSQRINPFKKLFPIDSIIKPNRPDAAGVKYYILRDGDHTGSNKFYDYRQIPYPNTAPRVYYPGVETYYKYWITPPSTGVNLTVRYIIETATVKEAYATATQVVYKTENDHGFKVGNRVTISGSGDSSLNFSNKQIIEVKDSKTFCIENTFPTNPTFNQNFVVGGTTWVWDGTNWVVYVSSITVGLTKTATLVNSAGVSTPTKAALANKIVVKFEKYHALPATCTLVITYKDNSTASPSAFTTPLSGILNVYWNGSAWTTSEPFTSSQAISYPAPKEIKSISVTTPAATGGGQMIGIIEVSARWVKDITSDVVSFGIDKESTSNPEDILPVGNLTANNLSLSLVNFNQASIRMLDYNRDLGWTTNPAPNDVIYFAKNMQINPHFKVFHANGAVTEGSLKYDRVNQGTFYLFNYSIGTYGDVSVEAMDSAKILMETLCPDLFLEDTKATSIIIALLDSVGFTNYNINVLLDGSNKLIDTSIPSIQYWWTEESKTVWETLQELCRDMQINAFVDENNILQVYTRDKMYSKTTVDWEFYHGNNAAPKLPNIISFSKKDLPTSNQVKIIWRTQVNSAYNGADTVWQEPVSYLIAGGLRESIGPLEPAENINFSISTDEAVDPITRVGSSFNFSGYFLVDSEIFEYDAMEYEYVELDAPNNAEKKKVFISSKADHEQYRVLSKTGVQNFYPTGRFRIKRRGVFGTKPAFHAATLIKPNTWTIITEDQWT